MDATTEHVDLYRIDLSRRVQHRIARVWCSAGGTFSVAAADEVVKVVMSRIECSAISPEKLSDLVMVFDSPQLMATSPHADEVCPFQGEDPVPMTSRAPSLRLLSPLK